VYLLNFLASKAKLIQVTSTATKYANKSFLSRLVSFFPYFSLWVEGWLWVGWVVSFGEFYCCFLFVVGGAGNELESTLLTPYPHTSQNQHPICMWIWLNTHQLYPNPPQSFSRSKQFSQDVQSNRQPPTEAQCSLW
jgi:hypothetical protein